MAGNKKPRKAHKPKVLKATPIVFALAGEQKTDLRLPYHLALESLRGGAGNSDDAHTIFSSLLIARELAKHYQTEQRQAIAAGLDAIVDVKARGDAGKWGVSGDQFKAISAALVLMDDMQDGATRRMVRDAIQTVWKEAA
jgi:hypothetical protein